jgi:hypothetical protein
MAALYADENVPTRLSEALVLLGHDVLTIQTDGRANQGIVDADGLARAVALGRAVLSNNWWDFVRLHRQNQVHAGVIVYTDDPDYPGLAGRIDVAIAALPTLVGALVRVYRPSLPSVP